MAITDEDEAEVARLLIDDIVSTMGHDHAELVGSTARHHRQFVDDVDRYSSRVVEAVQQYFHDCHIDTTGPACPFHPSHPMWFIVGWWCADGKPVARLGGLGSRLESAAGS